MLITKVFLFTVIYTAAGSSSEQLPHSGNSLYRKPFVSNKLHMTSFKHYFNYLGPVNVQYPMTGTC